MAGRGVLVLREPRHRAAELFLRVSRAGALQHERDKAGGEAIARRLERGAVDSFPRPQARSRPSAVGLLRLGGSLEDRVALLRSQQGGNRGARPAAPSGD